MTQPGHDFDMRSGIDCAAQTHDRISWPCNRILTMIFGHRACCHSINLRIVCKCYDYSSTCVLCTVSYAIGER